MKKVYFIGNGYECVKCVYVEAKTNGEAVGRAIDFYEKNGWTFKYCAIQVSDYD